MPRFKVELIAVLTGLLALAPAVSRAQQPGCTNDVQCKGDRICVNGRCKSPRRAPNRNRQPMVIDDGSKSYGDGDAGWTRGAGIMAMISAAAVIGLGSASAATSEATDDTPALAMGGAATLLGAVLYPIAASGGGSGSERGALGLRIVGWVTYGVFLANAAVLLSLGAIDDTTDYTPYIISTTALGGISGIAFGIDAFLAHANSTAVAQVNGQVSDVLASTPPPPLSLAIGQVADRNFDRVPTVGLRFSY